MSPALPSKRAPRASDAFAARLLRISLTILGGIIVLGGIAVAPLPGPGGLPVIVVGLMLVLRNSFKARRQFVRFQHAHPKMVSPIRRLLRREPQVVALFWQQLLRMERLVLPKRWRVLAKGRRKMRRRPGLA